MIRFLRVQYDTAVIQVDNLAPLLMSKKHLTERLTEKRWSEEDRKQFSTALNEIVLAEKLKEITAMSNLLQAVVLLGGKYTDDGTIHLPCGRSFSVKTMRKDPDAWDLKTSWNPSKHLFIPKKTLPDRFARVIRKIVVQHDNLLDAGGK